MLDKSMVLNSYIDLASEIVMQCYRDIEAYDRQAVCRERKKLKPCEKRNYTLVTKDELNTAEEFLKSDLAEYLIGLVCDYRMHYDNTKKLQLEDKGLQKINV